MYSWHMLASTAAYEWMFWSSPALAIILPSILQNKLDMLVRDFMYYTMLDIPGDSAFESMFFNTLGLSMRNYFDEFYNASVSI